MADYPNNSDKAIKESQNNSQPMPAPKEPPKEQPSVVQDIAHWAVDEFIKPRLKDMGHDFLTGIFNMSRDAVVGGYDKKTQGTNYERYAAIRHHEDYTRYSKGRDYRSTDIDYSRRSVFDSQYLSAPNEYAANKAKAKMIELIDNNGWARVSDLYQLLNYRSQPIDRTYGWNRASDIQVEKRYDTYVFVLPEPKPVPKNIQ